MTDEEALLAKIQETADSPFAVHGWTTEGWAAVMGWERLRTQDALAALAHVGKVEALRQKGMNPLRWRAARS